MTGSCLLLKLLGEVGIGPKSSGRLASRWTGWAWGSGQISSGLWSLLVQGQFVESGELIMCHLTVT